MGSFWNRLWPFAAAVASGLLLILCFPPWNQTWLCWVALTPLLSAVWFSRKRSWVQNLLLGYCAGLTFFWGVFYWLISVTGLGWFALSFYLALFFAFWAWFMGILLPASADSKTFFFQSRKNLFIAVMGAFAWIAHEWLRTNLFGGFGWNGIGVALHTNIALIQIAEITGIAGLSFMVAMVNIIAVITIQRIVNEIGRVRLRPHYDFSLTMAMVGIVFSFGVRAIYQKTETTPLKIAAVQANIPQDQKFNPAFEQKIFDTYTLLTETAIAGTPDLIAWPEAATPRTMFGDQVNYDFVMSFARRGDFNFLLGTIDFDDKGDYNVAVLLTDRGEQGQVYRKIHLVPFGEYIPLRHSFPLFAMIAGTQVPGDFLSGKEHVILKTKNPDVNMGPLICFEDTLGNLTRKFALNGAQMLVNVTNDGWFKKTAGAEQHLANAVFRTVETRLPMLRSANTGVTCVIDPLGRVTHSLRNEKGSHFLEGVLFAQMEIPKNPFLTFYTKNGEWFAFLGLTVTLLWLLKSGVTKARTLRN